MGQNGRSERAQAQAPEGESPGRAVSLGQRPHGSRTSTLRPDLALAAGPTIRWPLTPPTHPHWGPGAWWEVTDPSQCDLNLIWEGVPTRSSCAQALIHHAKDPGQHQNLPLTTEP